MDVALERQILARFIDPKRRDRFLGFIATEKGRDKVLWELNSPGVFDDRHLTQLSGPQRVDVAASYKALGMGGPVYVMCKNPDWDGQRFQMTYIAEQALLRGDDLLAYCWKTRTAFFEWHHAESFFLKKP